jgi:hypothetical protein
LDFEFLILNGAGALKSEALICAISALLQGILRDPELCYFSSTSGNFEWGWRMSNWPQIFMIYGLIMIGL